MPQLKNKTKTEPGQAEPDPDSAPQNVPAGILWMLATMMFFVGLDTTAKYLMQHYSVVQVVWTRFFLHTVFVLGILYFQTRELPRSNRPSLQLVRSVLLFSTTVLFFLGIKDVQLATASTIMFLYPVFLTILAIPLLGEQVGIRRWIGVAVGFAGAMIIVRPGQAEFEFSMVFLLAAAFSNAIYQIYTRKIRAHDDPLTSLFYTGIVGAVAMSVIVPFYWQVPETSHLPAFLLLGILGSVGHLCLIRAFRVAPASAIAPVSYSSLLWAVMFGFIIFGELPGSHVWSGGALILASGLYIYHRERRLAKSE